MAYDPSDDIRTLADLARSRTKLVRGAPDVSPLLGVALRDVLLVQATRDADGEALWAALKATDMRLTGERYGTSTLHLSGIVLSLTRDSPDGWITGPPPKDWRDRLARGAALTGPGDRRVRSEGEV